MKYKEFVKWCNDRACDGMWSMETALVCIRILSDIRQLPFWKRKKAWMKIKSNRQIEKFIEEMILNVGNNV